MGLPCEACLQMEGMAASPVEAPADTKCHSHWRNEWAEPGVQACKRTHTLAHVCHARMRAHTHACTHARTHTHAHTHAHTSFHDSIPPLRPGRRCGCSGSTRATPCCRLRAGRVRRRRCCSGSCGCLKVRAVGNTARVGCAPARCPLLDSCGQAARQPPSTANRSRRRRHHCNG